MMGQPGEILREGGMAIGLIRAMPPRSLVSSVKMGQYIARLAHSWRLASQLTEIAVFDQGFMQVIYSLTVLSQAPNEASIVNALDRIPKSNLLIRLDAPNQTLRLRLHERLGHQGAIERLLEPDVNTIVESKHIADRLSRLLRERGQLVFEATSVDRRSLCDNVEQVWHRIKSEVLPRAARPE
jgi:hypothetical protein